MTGEQLKAILQRMGVRQNDLAEKLGTTPQNLNAALLVKDVKTGTLERIAEALGVPVASFFPSPGVSIENNISYTGAHARSACGTGASVSGVDPEVVNRLLDELTETRKQNARLVELLAKQL